MNGSSDARTGDIIGAQHIRLSLTTAQLFGGNEFKA
jgi:hypothetical protein